MEREVCWKMGAKRMHIRFSDVSRGCSSKGLAEPREASRNSTSQEKPQGVFGLVVQALWVIGRSRLSFSGDGFGVLGLGVRSFGFARCSPAPPNKHILCPRPTHPHTRFDGLRFWVWAFWVSAFLGFGCSVLGFRVLGFEVFGLWVWSFGFGV